MRLPEIFKEIEEKEPHISRLIWLAIMIIFIFFGIFFVWALVAPLETAAVTSGKVVVESNRKTIQHLEGGIIQNIYIHEGQIVKKGTPLNLQ